MLCNRHCTRWDTMFSSVVGRNVFPSLANQRARCPQLHPYFATEAENSLDPNIFLQHPLYSESYICLVDLANFQTVIFARKLQFNENRNTLASMKFPFSLQDSCSKSRGKEKHLLDAARSHGVSNWGMGFKCLLPVRKSKNTHLKSSTSQRSMLMAGSSGSMFSLELIQKVSVSPQ